MHSRQSRTVTPVQQQGEKYLDRADYVIIGNGIAGLTAAVEARQLEPQKRIVMITDQLYPTINTPALKQFAIGKLDREQLLAYPSGTERRERIHVVTARVEEIHANGKYITLSGKRGFGYDKLLIATGSHPSGLPASTPGRDFDGVMTLHRLEDYLNLRRRLPEVRDAVVVGGGVHAIETVMGLLYCGVRVHWLIRGTTFMARMLDDASSPMVLEGIRRSGAQVYTQTEIVGIVGRMGSVAGVVTNQQDMIPCQLVLTCTGTQPSLTLAKSCSQTIELENGIKVDDQLQTNLPDIFAAGDVAALPNPLSGKHEPRAQWYSAVDQGRIAGAMMAGHEELARQPFGVHWHATHLGEHYMLTVGEPLKEDDRRIVTLTETTAKGFCRMAVLDDRLIGYLFLGKAQPDSLAIKRIIDEGHSVRAIKRDLLKGSFDARKYLSQVHSKAAQGIVTRKLPPLAEPLVKPSSTYEEPLRIPGARQERVAQPYRRVDPAAYQGATNPRRMEPAASQEGFNPRQTEPLQSRSQPLMEAESIDAFTGRLPTISRVFEPGELTPEPYSRQAREYDGADAFSGNLPIVSGVYTTGELTPGRPAPRVVPEAPPTLIPVETPEWNTEQVRGLWAYGEERRDARPAPSPNTRPAGNGSGSKKHTHGLWAYSEKRN